MSDILLAGGNQDDPLVNTINFSDRDVIEIGSGTGSFTLTYLENARYVLCVERNSEAAAVLQDDWAKATRKAVLDVQQGDIVDYQLPPATFDIAVFSHSF
jgi:16S rRNA A1518/A1519 N6-dimethyltransferase RsmA/KsgA/DIM1 with predicted DNA glycosylase/AP lyase activity